MGLQFNQVEKVQDDFIKKYWQAPYNEYINAIGISKINIFADSPSRPLVKPFNKSKDLRPDESLDDFCLAISFENTPPSNLLSKLPTEYKRVRVFYEEIGEIRLA